MTYLINQRLGLPDPFPSSPKRPPRFSLSIMWNDTLNTISFCELYAMHRVVTSILDGREFKWVKGDVIQTVDDGPSIRLKGELEDALEYEPGAKEQQWELPEPYNSMVRRICGKEPLKPEQLPADAKPPRKKRPPETSQAGRGRRRTSVLREKGELITIIEIAESIGMKPSKARQILRKRGVQPHDPATGWAWPPDHVAMVKEVLTK